MKKFRGSFLALLVVAAILAVSFFYGGGVPRTATGGDDTSEPLPNISEDVGESQGTGSAIYEMYADGETYEGIPSPIDPDSVVISDNELRCTISVRCDTLLGNIDYLKSEKRELVPEDGIILPETRVIFYEGESVFDVLSRQTRKNGIHLEFESTPLYGSVYIEGIANLYEFDCGELSGWMYKVNGRFPGYGCSRYPLSDGDKIEWVYTCNLGKDVGNGYEGEKSQ